MFYKTSCLFVVLAVITTAAFAINNVGVHDDIVLTADDKPVDFVAVDNNAKAELDKTGGNLYSLSVGKSDAAIDNGVVQVWIE